MKTLIAILLAATAAVYGDVEEKSTQQRSFTGAQKLILDDVLGSVDVTGYNGRDLQVEVTKTVKAESPERAEVAKREVTLDMNQSAGVVRVFVDGPFRCHCDDNRSVNYRGERHDGYQVTYDFRIKAPFGTFLDLRTVTHGGITLNHTVGDFALSDVNSPIELVQVSGSGEAHTVNGGVKATFVKSPAGNCSFRSVNGTLDVTFPPDLAADVRTKTFNGALYTDFDVSALPIPAASPERQNGKFVYRSHRVTGVRIGRGGAELNFDTLNGNVYIRKIAR
jgi:hypothetical protein